MIQELVTKLEINECDIAVCTRCRISDGVEISENIKYFEKVFDVSDLDISQTNTIYDWSNAIGKLYRRELIGTNRFPCEIKYGEDLYFATDIWKKANKAVYTNVAFYCYRFNQLSASYTLGDKKIEDRIVASVHAWEWIVERCPKSKKAMFDLCFGAYVSAYLTFKGKKKR